MTANHASAGGEGALPARGPADPLSWTTRLHTALALVAAIASGLALAGGWAGGLSLRAGPLRLSVHDAIGPGIAALAAGALLVARAGPRGAAAAFDRAGRSFSRLAPAVAAGAAIVVLVLGVEFGTRVAGGADAYGYISQAMLWRSGRTTIRVDPALKLPWPGSQWALAPLGYRPGISPDTIVPTYPPGLPLLMAGSALMGGSAAVFAVVPLFAGVAVWCTFLLGRRLFGAAVGGAAAALTAASPVFLYETMWPMSDVPVTAVWTLALLLACARTRHASWLSGLAAGLAVTIRPNLIVLIVPVAVTLAATTPARARSALPLYVAGLLPGLAFLAVVQTAWYGSPLRSGYGDVSALYSMANAWPNMARYGNWLLETETVFVLLAAAPFLTHRLRQGSGLVAHGAVRVALTLWCVLVAGAYLFYTTFDAWWYLRFLLPALPVLIVCACGAAAALLGSPRPRAALALMGLVAFPLTVRYVNTAAARETFVLAPVEQRYAAAGRALAYVTPPNAVLIAGQHSGSARFYSGRPTLRFDQIPPEWLDRGVETLRGRGYVPYFVLEDWEEAAFTTRFATANRLGALGWLPDREWPGRISVRLYNPAAATARRE